MAFEIDHVFVAATHADDFLARGFHEGPGNVHVGQGTANRRVFFENAYLEFLFLVNAAVARGERIGRTKLFERLSGAGCPFGICLRPTQDEAEIAPFDFWEFRPPYLSGDAFLPVSVSSMAADAPLCFVASNALAPAVWPEGRRPEINHPSGARHLNDVTLVHPRSWIPDAATRSLAQARLISLVAGDEWHLRLGFQPSTQHAHDLRPSLPMSIIV